MLVIQALGRVDKHGQISPTCADASSMNASQNPLSSLALPPSTLSALLRAGYETTHDLDASNAETLAHDLSIPLPSSQALLSLSQRKNATADLRRPPLSLSQPASGLVGPPAARIRTGCEPLDGLLGGGIGRGRVVEMSAAPGIPTDAIALGLVRSFLGAEAEGGGAEDVMVVDAQNGVTVSALRNALPGTMHRRVSHVAINTLPRFVAFIVSLPSVLRTKPKIRLVVFSSLHTALLPRTSLKPTSQLKTTVYEHLKQMLLRLTASGVTVFITAATSTKMLDADKSPATFSASARAVMVPILPATYLPSAYATRVLAGWTGAGTCVLRVIAPPGSGDDAPVKEEMMEIPYRQTREL
ncbi:unnamed protein product [Mycena citricolor]|uniref:DNA recombination and repair protein Rad51-like C-terminal domain-containing protein n=1 Tax=Mycena citricolor TaxID=2018698 RepID=A0AAD2HH00_9AGAR|nr:unnamed protein product [Mycena citricolor]